MKRTDHVMLLLPYHTQLSVWPLDVALVKVYFLLFYFSLKFWLVIIFDFLQNSIGSPVATAAAVVASFCPYVTSSTYSCFSIWKFVVKLLLVGIEIKHF